MQYLLKRMWIGISATDRRIFTMTVFSVFLIFGFLVGLVQVTENVKITTNSAATGLFGGCAEGNIDYGLITDFCSRLGKVLSGICPLVILVISVLLYICGAVCGQL